MPALLQFVLNCTVTIPRWLAKALYRLTEGAVSSFNASLRCFRVSVLRSVSSSSGPGRCTDDCRDLSSGRLIPDGPPFANCCCEDARRNGHAMFAFQIVWKSNVSLYFIRSDVECRCAVILNWVVALLLFASRFDVDRLHHECGPVGKSIKILSLNFFCYVPRRY